MKAGKTVFPMLISVSMIILVTAPVFVSADVSVLGNELPLKGFVKPQWGWSWQPDVTVDKITFDPESPTPGETVTITATIHNIGKRSARSVTVKFYVEGDPIGTDTISRIRAGRYEDASATWTPTTAGTYDIHVRADCDGDSNPENNEAYATITVGVPAPDVTAPTVEIVDPVNGQVISQKTYEIVVDATDAEGKIAAVWVSINETWKEITDNSDGTYYFYDWSITEEGTYIIGANATDDSDNTGYAAQVTVTVEFPVVVADKWALLIGISDYEGTENDLWNPHRDASDMYTALTTLYDFPEDNIHMLLNESATMDTILAEIDWLNSVEDSPDDVVVFFFCGHGYQTSEWNWQWRNADRDREADRRDEFIVSYDLWAYADGYLAKKFATFDSDNLFLWFGSCYSGGMDDIYKAKGFSGVLCTACKENQYGYDVKEFDNTLFGEFYVDQGTLHKQGDVNNDGIVTVEEAFNYAYDTVIAWVDWYNENYGAEYGYIDQDPCMFDTDPAIDFCL